MVWSGRVPILVSTTILLLFFSFQKNPCLAKSLRDFARHPKPLEELNEPEIGIDQLRLDPDVNLQVAGAPPLLEDTEGEHTELHRRQYSPNAPDPWHSGASGTWSRGANPR
jgi:hypothetical protein